MSELPVATLSGEKAIISGKDAESLNSRGYGTKADDKLVLEPYEALFLVEKGMIEVKGKNGEKLSFQDLLQYFRKYDRNLWVRFLIYRDLRNRGYVVREGFGLGIDFRLYERGDYGKEPAKSIVFGILEGKPISIRDLFQVLRKVQSLKKKLILAVADRKGEVVYYTLSKLSLGEMVENAEI